jgi:hypothetical protein
MARRVSPTGRGVTRGTPGDRVTPTNPGGQVHGKTVAGSTAVAGRSRHERVDRSLCATRAGRKSIGRRIEKEEGLLMAPTIAQVLDGWSTIYSNAPALRTALEFAHIGGLVVGAGWAITADRAILGARRGNADDQRRHLQQLHVSHRYVLAGLALVVASGLLLFAADTGTYLHSRVFWMKMAAIVLLAANGAWLRRVGREAGSTPHQWSTLRRSAIFSLALWSVVTFLGAALSNVN